MISRRFRSIMHPTDLSQSASDAFAHALRLALLSNSTLHVIHTCPHQNSKSEEIVWSSFPKVHEMLARWGIKPQSSNELPLKVVKADIESKNPVHGVAFYLKEHPCDLLVLWTHAHDGFGQWLKESIAESIAYNVQAPALFLTEGKQGFVDAETGVLSLQTILLPVDASLPYKEAWLWLADFVRITAPFAKLHLLHVGSEKPSNAHQFTDVIEIRQGPVVETIIEAANDLQADMIAMPTMGQGGLFGLLRGSVTSKVLHRAPCSVLAIPIA